MLLYRSLKSHFGCTSIWMFPSTKKMNLFLQAIHADKKLFGKFDDEEKNISRKMLIYFDRCFLNSLAMYSLHIEYRYTLTHRRARTLTRTRAHHSLALCYGCLFYFAASVHTMRTSSHFVYSHGVAVFSFISDSTAWYGATLCLCVCVRELCECACVRVHAPYSHKQFCVWAEA